MSGSGANPYGPPADGGESTDPATYVGRFRGMLMRYWFDASALHVELDESLTHSLRLDRPGVRLRQRTVWLGGLGLVLALAGVLLLTVLIAVQLLSSDPGVTADEAQRTAGILIAGLVVCLLALAPLVLRAWRTGSLGRQRLAMVGDRRYQIIIRVLDGRVADYEAFLGEVRKRVGEGGTAAAGGRPAVGR